MASQTARPGSAGFDVAEHERIGGASTHQNRKSSQIVAIITARSEQKPHQALMLAGAAAFYRNPLISANYLPFVNGFLPYGAYLNLRALQNRQQERDQTINQRVQAAHFY